MRAGWTDGTWTERWYNNGIYKDRSSKGGKVKRRHDCWRADVRSTGGQRERRRFRTLREAKEWVFGITGKWPNTIAEDRTDATSLDPVTADDLRKSSTKPPCCSDVRWRIELRRRQASSYYSLCEKP